MKYLLILLCSSFLFGCAESHDFNGRTVEPYGLLNEDARKENGVKYEVSAGSVVVAIIFCETIIAPVYVVGWDLMEPVRIDTTK